MNQSTRKVAFFSLCVALMLVLGLLDRAVPLSALLSGGIPGLKLGLANTVLLYAVYMLNWKESLLLLLAKVLLSGFLFGSLSAILYSLSGGLLSLAVMLLARKSPSRSALVIGVLGAACDLLLLSRNPTPGGQLFQFEIMIAIAALVAMGFSLLIRRLPRFGIIGVSLAGAVSHNVGQVFAAALMLRTPRLLSVYLPILIGLGAAVGCLTGLIAQRVLHALHQIPGKETGDGSLSP